MKQTIRLTESTLRGMIQKAVNKAMSRPRRNPTRLAESKLRNMIQEAVSGALNEMDPRTYASAEKKAEEQGDFERAKRFRKAGVDAWNRDWERDEEEDTTPDNPNPFTAYPTIRRRRYMTDNNGVMDMHMYDYHDGELPKGWYRYFSPEDTDKIYKRGGKKVAQQMAKGTGTYIKGKGWK